MEDREEKLLGYLLRQIETNPSLARAKTLDSDGTPHPTRSHYIKLQRYTKNFLEDKTDQRIMIMPGLRGIGKTTYLVFVIFSMKSKEFLKNKAAAG